MLHFEKIIAVAYWVFAQFLSKISPFALFFDKKQQNKDDVPLIKYVIWLVAGKLWLATSHRPVTQPSVAEWLATSHNEKNVCFGGGFRNPGSKLGPKPRTK